MNKQNLLKVGTDIVNLLEEKTKHYGDSWKSRGGSGAFHNIARKWDRLENQCKKNKYDVFESILQDKKGEEGVKDSLIDLVGYGLLILSEMDQFTCSNKFHPVSKSQSKRITIMEGGGSRSSIKKKKKYHDGQESPYGFNEKLDSLK